MADDHGPLDAIKREKLLSVARLRAMGKTWDECSTILKMSHSTITHWPNLWPKAWAECVRDALDDALSDYEVEALTVCRKHLRIKSEEDNDLTEKDAAMLRQSAARDILKHCQGLRSKLVKLEHSGPGGAPLAATVVLIDAAGSTDDDTDDDTNTPAEAEWKNVQEEIQAKQEAVGPIPTETATDTESNGDADSDAATT